MSTPRAPVLLALFVILLTAGYCKKSARRVVLERTSTVPDGRSLIELIMDKVRLARDGHADGRTEYPVKKLNFSFEAKENNDVNKSHHIIEVFPRDLARKEKIIKHFTGPLYFNPKCRKHFYRLYHNTRDCTIPDFYKRCARLLIRLAGSQRCSER